MKNFFSVKKILFLSLLLFVIYSLSTIVNQQMKLNSYEKQKEYLQGQLANEKERNEDLVSMEENVNSPEYIEEIARDKLDMYLPNERVYIDINK